MGTFNMCVINELIELNFMAFNNIPTGEDEENLHVIVISLNFVKLYSIWVNAIFSVFNQYRSGILDKPNM